MKESESLDAPFYINKASNSLNANPTTATLKEGNGFAFHNTLPHYKPSPLIYLDNIAEKYTIANMYFKDESVRFGLNSFKGLGTSFAMDIINKEKPGITTFCTATDGNHGRAVAWSAKQFNKKAVIFVPRDTTTNRIKAIEK